MKLYLELEDDACEALRQRVMYLARHAVPLVQYREVPCLLCEPCILDDIGELVGNGLRREHVHLVKAVVPVALDV